MPIYLSIPKRVRPSRAQFGPWNIECKRQLVWRGTLTAWLLGALSHPFRLEECQRARLPSCTAERTSRAGERWGWHWPHCRRQGFWMALETGLCPSVGHRTNTWRGKEGSGRKRRWSAWGFRSPCTEGCAAALAAKEGRKMQSRRGWAFRKWLAQVPQQWSPGI